MGGWCVGRAIEVDDASKVIKVRGVGYGHRRGWILFLRLMML
jgi:hypothetical protein